MNQLYFYISLYIHFLSREKLKDEKIITYICFLLHLLVDCIQRHDRVIVNPKVWNSRSSFQLFHFDVNNQLPRLVQQYQNLLYLAADCSDYVHSIIFENLSTLYTIVCSDLVKTLGSHRMEMFPNKCINIFKMVKC